ncbi:helix-turn-helix transcriptional regulator [Aliiglaciecola sp. 2_MG-2023]|uniref:helix-turn-helix domain-containing protein n=1 Tax=unclassified Aliiglaciecola TaxID=2593648 RepID=UPI0026E30D91|nr:MULTISPECIES: helix-turn-helix transcriptional regulator [unclassified Aliiglaciecola]MDO6710352.1 helix-turn-helix transcriptional regulator [Aliiglaciecola sp. 2_MG-2023]MDO6751499.1 helix-turn-helix transcriptional regulator [Aliiglaciecola sp. 1_MG-2023]
MIRINLKQKLLEKAAEDGNSLTIDEVAEACGISRITLLRIKSDPLRPTKTDIIDKLCKYFKCPIEDILTFEDED